MGENGSNFIRHLTSAFKVFFSLKMPSKYEQTHKLKLICSNVLKKAITENSKFSYCVSTDMNPIYCKYTLQRSQHNIADSNF